MHILCTDENTANKYINYNNNLYNMKDVIFCSSLDFS